MHTRLLLLFSAHHLCSRFYWTVPHWVVMPHVHTRTFLHCGLHVAAVDAYASNTGALLHFTSVLHTRRLSILRPHVRRSRASAFRISCLPHYTPLRVHTAPLSTFCVHAFTPHRGLRTFLLVLGSHVVHCHTHGHMLRTHALHLARTLHAYPRVAHILFATRVPRSFVVVHYAPVFLLPLPHTGRRLVRR